MQLQSSSLITAIDELIARGYRVRHDGVVADFCADQQASQARRLQPARNANRKRRYCAFEGRFELISDHLARLSSQLRITHDKLSSILTGLIIETRFLGPTDYRGSRVTRGL